ncbi:MAG TPA: hypothetical protein VGA13_12905 [Acidimicrobiales bacterium]
MSRRTVAQIAALSLTISVIPLVAPQVTARADTDPVTVATPNMEWVATVAYATREGYESPRFADDAGLIPLDSSFGTDLEVASWTVDHDGGRVERDFVVAGSYRNGMQLIDVTDPEQPVIAQTFDCGIAQGDVQIFQRVVDGQTRTYAAYGQDDISGDRLLDTECFRQGLEQEGYTGSGTEGDASVIDAEGGVSGTFIFDITEPYHQPDNTNPVRVVGWARWPTGSHNTTVDPTGRYIYNSNQDLLPANVPGDGKSAFQIEVFDIGEPDPTTGNFDVELAGSVQLDTGLGPHDITFNEVGDRAYVAAISHTVVLDTSEPAQPEVIGVIEDPAISIHHQADPIPVHDPLLGERVFLVISDELAGVIQGAGACPGGGLHVYDVTGDLERTPVKVGYFAIPQTEPATQYHLRCTAHVFRTYDTDGDGGHDVMTIAWYGAGVRVIDLNGLAGASVGASGVGSLGTAPVTGMREIGSIYLPEISTVDADGNRIVEQDGSQTWSAKVLEWEDDGSAFIFANDLDRGFEVYRFDGTRPSGPGGTWLGPDAALELASERGVLSARTAGVRYTPYCVVLPQGVEGYETI